MGTQQISSGTMTISRREGMWMRSILCFFAFCVCNIAAAEGDAQAVRLAMSNETSFEVAVGHAGSGVLRSSASRKLKAYTCDVFPAGQFVACGSIFTNPPWSSEPFPGCCTAAGCTGIQVIGGCAISCKDPQAQLACCDGYQQTYNCNAPPATATSAPTTPSTTRPPVTNSPAALPQATLPSANKTASAPTQAVPLGPSLDPKVGDKVITSTFAVGTVSWFCADPVNGTFDINGFAAILYSNRGLVVGNLTSRNDSLLFNLTSGSAVVGPLDVGDAYPVPSNTLTDGGYGSLPVQYTSASGAFGAARVTAITFTATNGGVLPENAPCTVLPFLTEVLPPWSVPFQANITFFSLYTPPQ
eukprot:TRINITY_DN3630_c0_g1_i1.p1 TRINITY_DN3630_c0_g1~~TRINITY_DN3630_c0_g1_i1.p1  ORF type:complete len:358 (-),score=44.74 TRINITY_DN3630_c0_g1_i1:576-1649(-)